MVNLIKKPIFVVPAAIVIAVFVGGYFYFSQNKPPAYEFVVAQKGDIVQEVAVTGKVKPAASVDLAFESGGRAVWIGVETGDRAAKGQILARLYSGGLAAQLSQAKANARVEEAKLEELKKGTRPEKIKIQEAKVAKAKTTLNESKKDSINKIQDAYTKSDDAVRNKIDKFFSNPRSPNPQLNFSVSDSGLKVNVESDRFKVEDILVSWKSSLGSLSVSGDLNFYINKAKQNLNEIKSFLDKTALAVNSLTVDADHSQSVIDGWKSDVSTGRTNVNTAITNLLAAVDKLKLSQNNLTLEENELALEKAGSTAEQISAQEAAVESAEANVSNIKAQITKTVLYSPINGIITNVDAKVGEIVAPNVSVISVISEKRFKIEADVPEADIAKVKIGQTAELTLDAYGDNVVFKAKTVLIDPAATIIEGVPTYKTTFQFIGKDGRVRPGMTANLEIATGSRKNAVNIPQRAIIEKGNGEKIVRVVGKNGAIKDVKVKTGLKGSFGEVEILDGIKEGDKVIIFMKEQ